MSTPALWTLPQGTAREVLVLVAVVLLGRNLDVRIGYVHAKEASTLVEFLLPIAVSQETVVTNALEPVRQHVQQETPDKFIGGQRHRFHLPATAVILPLKAHLIVFDIEQAVIRDSHAVGIPAHIVEHLLGTGERALGIDHPLMVFQLCAMSCEIEVLPKRPQASKNRSFLESNAFCKASRNRRRNRWDRTRTGKKKFGWQEIQRWPSGDSPPPGYDTMQVRVKLEVLSPTVKHGEKANLSSQVLRIGCDSCQSFGRGMEEDAVDDFLVLIGDRGDLFRHREHNMKIGCLQKLGLSVFNPLRPG